VKELEFSLVLHDFDSNETTFVLYFLQRREALLHLSD